VRSSLLLVLLLLLLMAQPLSGCTASTDDDPSSPSAVAAGPTGAHGDPAPSVWFERGEDLAPGSAVSWGAVGAVEFGQDGRSTPVALPSPAGCRARVLRISDLPGAAPRGFSAELPWGQVEGGAGYGLFLVPAGITAVSFSLMDPVFGGPLLDASLLDAPASLELACSPSIPPGAPLRLELRVAVPGGRATAPLLGQAWWASAVGEARRQLAAAGVELVVTAVAHLPERCHEETVTGPGAPAGAEALLQRSAEVLGDDAARPIVPVTLVRKLRWVAPGGQSSASLAALSTRIPGGFSPGPASGVLLATEDDDRTLTAPEQGRWLGMILAHELGHYLGLQHDDPLHTPPGASSTLMSARIAQLEPDEVSFSDEQRQALRMHPLVTFPEHAP
jgi:hypothetical protein